MAHEGVELKTRSPAFGQQSTVAFDMREETLCFLWIGKYDGLAIDGTTFCTSDIEGIAEAGYVGEGDIGVESSETISQACPVEI